MLGWFGPCPAWLNLPVVPDRILQDRAINRLKRHLNVMQRDVGIVALELQFLRAR